MNEPKCGECKFWDFVMQQDGKRNLGVCRIRSVPNTFPQRYDSEWCGEYQPKQQAEVKGEYA